MGLYTTHDCWHGSYGGFLSWRRAVCEAAGLGKLDDYVGFGGDKQWPVDDVLVELLSHSDCDGIIPAASCAPLANRLESILFHGPVAFIHRDHTAQFIVGLRLAAEAGEDVEFH